MHDYAPRLFTNDYGSIFQYEDASPDWRWGLLTPIRSIADTKRSGDLFQLPLHWVIYAELNDPKWRK